MQGYFLKHNNTPKHVTDLSRVNRLNPTMQEEKLWSAISNRKLEGCKFRQQFPIGRYIVDFYSHANRLVIEVDGEIHSERQDYDLNRDTYLIARGYTVLRFPNKDIDSDLESVLKRIREYLKKVPLRGI